jgi:NAD(P)-dependent dehydrogenase (short-subunit alcohol dehydrogenase family)
MLKKKVAVITGASSGIGSALALLLAREGASVVLAARRTDRLRGLEATLREEGHDALAHRCDVTRRDEAEELIARALSVYGRLDILVNNAGRGNFASVEDTTDEMIRTMFEVNVYSLWYTTRPALRQMRSQGNGHIINVASIAGKIGFPYNSAYVAAKHACVGFTHALRLELLETGIHASVVCPAGVLTDWAASTEGGPILEMFSQSGPLIKKIAAERGIPLPTVEGVVPPETVAKAIVECIRHPVAEVYTHRGSHEFALLAAGEWEAAERRQLPASLGEREIYARLKRK